MESVRHTTLVARTLSWVHRLQQPELKDEHFPPTNAKERGELILNSPHTFLKVRIGTILRKKFWFISYFCSYKNNTFQKNDLLPPSGERVVKGSFLWWKGIAVSWDPTRWVAPHCFTREGRSYTVWTPVLFMKHWTTHTYLLTYLLTLRITVLLEKLTGFHLVKELTAFYGTRRFITAVTSARHLSLSWANIKLAQHSPCLHIPLPEDPS